MDISVNWGAVIVAALSNMVIGFLWYGPLFGKMWVREMKWTPEEMEAAKKKGMSAMYLLTFVGALLMSYILAHFVEYVGAVTMSDALSLAFWVWLGFFVPFSLSQITWEGKSKSLWLLNIGYYLVVLAVAASILTVWY
jgi:hypothetical protein